MALPEFYLRIADMIDKKRVTYAGAAFRNEFGGYNISLNPGVLLNWQDGVYISLVPSSDVCLPRRKSAEDEATERKELEDEKFFP